jgi:hypothetical protein
MFRWQQWGEDHHVQYIGCIVTLPIYWVLGNTIQYGSMSYGVIQYAPLNNTIILRGGLYCQYRIVYIISNTDHNRTTVRYPDYTHPCSRWKILRECWAILANVDLAYRYCGGVRNKDVGRTNGYEIESSHRH